MKKIILEFQKIDYNEKTDITNLFKKETYEIKGTDVFIEKTERLLRKMGKKLEGKK